MANQKGQSPDKEPGVPPKPEPLPGPSTPPQHEPAPPPGEPPVLRPGDPIPHQSPGLFDPRHLSPAPDDPLQGISSSLEVEHLPGPTEASDDGSAPNEPDDSGLVDPRRLMPGPGKPTAKP